MYRPQRSSNNDQEQCNGPADPLGPNTALVRAGYDPFDYHGFVNPPKVHASTVLFPDAQTMDRNGQKYTYATRGTPTTDALCNSINELEGRPVRSSFRPGSPPLQPRCWRICLPETTR